LHGFEKSGPQGPPVGRVVLGDVAAFGRRSSACTARPGAIGCAATRGLFRAV